MNVHELHGGGLPWVQNSWVVFDMPTEIITIFPDTDGLPFASSGWTDCAFASPSLSCAAGITFPPAYNPPANPR